MTDIKNLVSEHGLELPQAPVPVGRYKATVIAGNLLYISGQLPIKNGKIIYRGRLGKELSMEQGKEAAQLCALNILSQIEVQLAHRKLKQIIKVEGYINAIDSFEEHAEVLNGASDLFAKILGDKSGHIRTVVGCTSLPKGVAVEISAIAEMD